MTTLNAAAQAHLDAVKAHLDAIEAATTPLNPEVIAMLTEAEWPAEWEGEPGMHFDHGWNLLRPAITSLREGIRRFEERLAASEEPTS